MYGRAPIVISPEQRLKNRIAHALEDAFFGSAQTIDGVIAERQPGLEDAIKLTFADNTTFVGSRELAAAKLLLVLQPAAAAAEPAVPAVRASDDGCDDGGQ